MIDLIVDIIELFIGVFCGIVDLACDLLDLIFTRRR